MKSEIISQEQNVIVIKAEYDIQTAAEAIRGAYRDLAANVNIKGFRKGHVPAKMLELHLGRPAIYRHAMEELLRHALETVVREHDLNLVIDPQITAGRLEEGMPFEVTLTLEVRPEVVLPELTDLIAERTVHEVTDELVESSVNRFLDSAAELKSTGEDRPLTETDIAEVEYSSSVVDSSGKVTELEEKKKNTIFLGQETLRPEIKEALLGKKLAEEVCVELQVEADHPEKRLAGKTLRYNMEVMDILRREVPELTDEVAEKISQGRFKSAEELREGVRQQVAMSLSMKDAESLRNSAVDKLASACEMEIPDSMIQRQKDAMRRGHEDQIRKDLGQSLDEYLQNNSLDPEEFDKGMADRAREIVRNSLAVDALMDKENIGCTAEDVDREVTSMAYNMGVEPDQLKKYFVAERDRIQEVVAQVRSRKTVDFLVSKVQVTNVPVENNKE